MDPAIEPMIDWRRRCERAHDLLRIQTGELDALRREVEIHRGNSEDLYSTLLARAEKAEAEITDLKVIIDALGVMLVRMANGPAPPAPAADVRGVAPVHGAREEAPRPDRVDDRPSPAADRAGAIPAIAADPGDEPPA